MSELTIILMITVGLTLYASALEFPPDSGRSALRDAWDWLRKGRDDD